MTRKLLKKKFKSLVRDLIEMGFDEARLELGDEGRLLRAWYFKGEEIEVVNFPPVQEDVPDEHFKLMYDLTDEEWEAVPKKLKVGLGASDPDEPFVIQSLEPTVMEQFAYDVLCFGVGIENDIDKRERICEGEIIIGTSPRSLYLSLSFCTISDGEVQIFGVENALN